MSDRDTTVETLKILVFVKTVQARDEELVSGWLDLAKRFGLTMEIEFVEISNDPVVAGQYDIVFTPTIIAEMPNGKEARYVGYSTDIEMVIRSCGWLSYTQSLNQNIQEITNRNANVLADAQKMREEALRMHNSTLGMRNRLNKT